MGHLTKQVFGDVNGAVGHVVFKKRAGSNYIAMRVEKLKATLDPVVLARRSKFAMTGKIAKAVNSLAVLKAAWPVTDGRMSRFNEIFQANYKIIGSAANILSAAVAPMFGFSLTNSHVTTLATGVQMTTDALGVKAGIDTGTEKYIVAAGIIVLSTPNQDGLPPTIVLSFKSPQHNLDLINPIDLTAELEGTGLVQYGYYTTKKAFACLVTLDDNGQTVHTSLSVQS
ncbi:MAG: hypothetical protein P4L27_14010 [Ignavibacteriaceae bacterium]|nr:hypothetical protein [Ignavibacteriaceae bacterium]